MSQEEKRYRLNLTLQPYEDLKTLVGWTLVLSVVVLVAVVWALFLIWPLILGALLVAAAVVAIRAVLPATDAPDQARGVACKKCGFEGDPIITPSALGKTFSCKQCRDRDLLRFGPLFPPASDFNLRCLNCSSWRDSWFIDVCMECGGSHCWECVLPSSTAHNGYCPHCRADYGKSKSLGLEGYMRLRNQVGSRFRNLAKRI